jgi:CheY-like chemotaxis protein
MKSILQVEDEENDVFFFKLAAEKAGLFNPLHVVRDGREAIDYLAGTHKYADRQQFPLPAIIVLDLKLPHVPGLDVLKFIRSQPHLAKVVVIVFSSSDQDSDVEAAYVLGANSYIVKPANPSQLNHTIDLIKAYWLRLCRLPA